MCMIQRAHQGRCCVCVCGGGGAPRGGWTGATCPTPQNQSPPPPTHTHPYPHPPRSLPAWLPQLIGITVPASGRKALIYDVGSGVLRETLDPGEGPGGLGGPGGQGGGQVSERAHKLSSVCFNNTGGLSGQGRAAPLQPKEAPCAFLPGRGGEGRGGMLPCNPCALLPCPPRVACACELVLLGLLSMVPAHSTAPASPPLLPPSPPGRPWLARAGELVLWGATLWDPRVPRALHTFDQLSEASAVGAFHPNGLELLLNSEVWDLR